MCIILPVSEREILLLQYLHAQYTSSRLSVWNLERLFSKSHSFTPVKSETTFDTSAKSKLLFSLDKTDCSFWLTTARILNSQRSVHTTPFFIGLYHNLFISQRWEYDPVFPPQHPTRNSQHPMKLILNAFSLYFVIGYSVFDIGYSSNGVQGARSHH